MRMIRHPHRMGEGRRPSISSCPGSARTRPATRSGRRKASNWTRIPPGSRAEQRRRTEARILDAAARAFFAAGYDRTTIRAVASAAGVDAGLVMHYFGSKQELFRRVIDAAPVPEVSGTPAEAAERILAGLASRLASEPVASLALLLSMLTNPEAASAARRVVVFTKAEPVLIPWDYGARVVEA